MKWICLQRRDVAVWTQHRGRLGKEVKVEHGTKCRRDDRRHHNPMVNVIHLYTDSDSSRSRTLQPQLDISDAIESGHEDTITTGSSCRILTPTTVPKGVKLASSPTCIGYSFFHDLNSTVLYIHTAYLVQYSSARQTCHNCPVLIGFPHGLWRRTDQTRAGNGRLKLQYQRNMSVRKTVAHRNL